MAVVFWVTEALPLAVTAMLGSVLAVVLGVAPVRTALASFADPVVFVFIGGFMLAEAMFVHGVDRRIAYTALSWRAVGRSATRILWVFGGVTTVLSMWMSNTATTAMMFPIGLSIVAHLTRSGASGGRRFAMVTMLITSFGASIGGIGTPVGTPPNLIGIGMLERLTKTDITFFQWMQLGVPIVVLMFAFLAIYFWLLGARGIQLSEESSTLVQEELDNLGPLSRGQLNVLVAFGVTVILWVIPGLFALLGMDGSPTARAYNQAVPESVAAMIGAFLLFVLPVDWRARRFTLGWDDAQRIDWGVVFLYGGGLAMGELAFSTGLAGAMGNGIAAMLPTHTTTALTILFTGTAIVLSEATSNTAAANMIVPIAIAVASASGIPPLQPALGATLGASMGFMLPVSTPPNAIVYSSGYIPIGQMMRYGILLDLVGFVVIVAVVLGLSPLVFP
jgi:sodium-dependent dicarboxylate transporter 2/3/5